MSQKVETGDGGISAENQKVHSSKYRLYQNFPNLGPKEKVIKYLGMVTVVSHHPKKFLTDVKNLDENLKSYFDSQSVFFKYIL